MGPFRSLRVARVEVAVQAGVARAACFLQLLRRCQDTFMHTLTCLVPQRCFSSITAVDHPRPSATRPLAPARRWAARSTGRTRELVVAASRHKWDHSADSHLEEVYGLGCRLLLIVKR